MFTVDEAETDDDLQRALYPREYNGSKFTNKNI